MKDELITFETAKLAKEKGLVDKERSTNYYLPDGGMDIRVLMKNPDIRNKGYGYYAPTQSLLQRWLREVHSIDVFIVPAIKENHYEWVIIDNSEMRTEADECFVTYEQALEEGLKEALKLIP